MFFGRYFSVIVIITLMTFVFSRCSGSHFVSDDSNDPNVSLPLVIVPLPSSHPGEVIKLSPVNPAYAAICNNSGMSGAPVGRVHWHTNSSSDMYAGSKNDFTFDLGHIDQLGELHIWNYNASGGSNGLKNVTVSFSEDNTNYTVLGSFSLKRANGEAKLPVTNLENGSVINFKGKSARYIKISPESNHGGGQWGLSEVRLFRYRNAVYKGAYIAASPIYNVRATLPAAGYYNLTNGAGLSDPVGSSAVHDNNPEHMFYTNGGTGTFDIDLQGSYPVERMVIWNYNGAGNTSRGLKTVEISTSNNAPDSNSSWIVAVEATVISEGTGQNGLSPSLVLTTNFTARYIRISGPSIGGSQSGLSAIQCYVGDGWFADNVPDWTGLLSVYPQGRSNEWAGGDGFYSVNLDGKDYDFGRSPEDKKTFFTFQDTLTSRVNPVSGERIGWGMPHNTRGTLTGGFPLSVNLKFNTNAIRVTPSEPSRFYWIGDIFVIGDKLYIFANKIDNSAGGVWGFRHIGVDLVRFTIRNNTVDESSLKIIKDTNKKLLDSGWSLGSVVFENTEEAGALNPDGYIYLYGTCDNNGRRLIVVRVKAEEVEDFTKYQYLWNDNTWRTQAWGASYTNQKFLNLADETNFSGECSIHEVKSGPDKGKFWQVYMDSRYFDRWVRIRTADSPAGDFRNMKQIFYAVDPFNQIPLAGQDGMYVYNGKAHPAVSPDDELYITYNVNGGDGGKYADIYRPRFIRYAQVPAHAPEN